MTNFLEQLQCMLCLKSAKVNRTSNKYYIKTINIKKLKQLNKIEPCYILKLIVTNVQ